MRLTLRTLLAYRDRVLGPEDSKDLHIRIQKSEFASNLLRRIDAVSKSSEVPAPPLSLEEEGGYGANGVSEYLDDVIQSARVPEFERECLMSDANLAELAHCHEILSSALSTTLSVPAQLRREALTIADPAERAKRLAELRSTAKTSTKPTGKATVVGAPQAASQNVRVDVSAPMMASRGGTINPKGMDLEHATIAHEVPDYLRGASSMTWRIPLAIVGLIALLVVLVWQALGPWDEVASMFSAQPTDAEAGSGDTPSPIRNDRLPAEDDETAPGAAADDSDDLRDNIDQSSPNSQVGPPQNAASPEIDSADPDSNNASASDAPAPDNGPPLAEAAPSKDTNANAEMQSTALWNPATVEESGAVVLVGRDAGYQRIAAQKAVQPGKPVVLPAAMTSSFDLGDGIQLTVRGGSILQFTDPTDGVMSVTSELCRATLTFANAKSSFTIKCPVAESTVVANQPGATVSVEVGFRPTSVGTVTDDKVFSPALVVIALDKNSSLLSKLVDGRQISETLEFGSGWAIVGDARPKKFELRRIPEWLRSDWVRPIDRVAAQDLAALIEPATGLQPGLTEALKSFRPYTRAAAVQVAMLCGDWQPLTSGFLSDPRMRGHWTGTLDLANQLLASSPASADALKQQLTASLGAAEAHLAYKAIAGRSADELDAGGWGELVAALESSELTQRVCAIYALKRLTGEQFGYLPHAPNRASVLTWRRELAANRLSASKVGDPIWERIAL